MTDKPIVCRSIESGAASQDGNFVVLLAESGADTYQICMQTDQVPRLLVLLSNLMQDANNIRKPPSPPVLEPRAIEFESRPDQGREILRIQLGEDRGSSLYFAVPIGQLEEVSKGILTALGRIGSSPKGSAH